MMDLFQAFLLLVQTHALAQDAMLASQAAAVSQPYAPAAGGVVAIALHVPEHVLRNSSDQAKPPHMLNFMAAQLVDWQFGYSQQPGWFDIEWVKEWEDSDFDEDSSLDAGYNSPDSDGPEPDDAF